MGNIHKSFSLNLVYTFQLLLDNFSGKGILPRFFSTKFRYYGHFACHNVFDVDGVNVFTSLSYSNSHRSENDNLTKRLEIAQRAVINVYC